MNQILSSDIDSNLKHNSSNKTNNKKHLFFKFQFFLCTFVALSFSIKYLYNLYDINQKEKISKQLVNNFYIENLYKDNSSYEANRSSINNSYVQDENKFDVIGLIEINSININYPILSYENEELLKIAPCKFAGPNLNEIGNVCIAGHNYNNYKFFSKLKNLKIGDIINIYDLTRKKNSIFYL